jgi:hypothetical protein
LAALVPSAAVLVVQLTGAAPRAVLVPSAFAPLLLLVIAAWLLPAALPVALSVFIGVVLQAASVSAIMPPRIMPGIVVFMNSPEVVYMHSSSIDA